MGLCFHFLCLKHRHSFWLEPQLNFCLSIPFCHWDTLLPELLAKHNGAGYFCQLDNFFPSRIWLLCQCHCYRPLLSRAPLSVFLPWIKLSKIMWMLPISEYQITKSLFSVCPFHHVILELSQLDTPGLPFVQWIPHLPWRVAAIVLNLFPRFFSYLNFFLLNEVLTCLMGSILWTPSQ